MSWDCIAYKSYWLRGHFLLVARSDHTTGSRNVKPEVVFKVQKMAQYASFCLIMDPFKGEVPVFARLWPVRVRVSFTTGVVWSAIPATARLLVYISFYLRTEVTVHQYGPWAEQVAPPPIPLGGIVCRLGHRSRPRVYSVYFVQLYIAR